MDIYINAPLNKTHKILKKAGFNIKRNRNHFSAVKPTIKGRYHALYNSVDKKVYVDLHFDNKIHFLLWGVDYKSAPEQFFRTSLRKLILNKTLKHSTKRVGWLSRRNKALITGFKL